MYYAHKYILFSFSIIVQSKKKKLSEICIYLYKKKKMYTGTFSYLVLLHEPISNIKSKIISKIIFYLQKQEIDKRL